MSNQARTGKGRQLVVDRRAVDGGEEVVVGGSWPRGAERTFQRSVLDPAGYAAGVLRLQLASLGIDVKGGVRRAYVPDGAHELIAFEGRPLSDVVRRFLKFSNNPIGEALIKSLSASADGAPGSWKGGTAVVRRELDALGPADRGAGPGRRIGALVRRPRVAAAARRSSARGVALVPLRCGVRREPADRRHRRHARAPRASAPGPSCARRPDCSRA